MGKKKSASTSDAARVSRDWSASAISSRDINKLHNLGFISASRGGHSSSVRSPPKAPKGLHRHDVDYLDYPMKESVQGWRNKWFYLRDPAVSGQRPNLPPFEDKLVAKPKKSWHNALSPEEIVIADKLFDQVVALKNTGGLTMCGTEVPAVAQCYPPILESGVEPEDDNDNSEETEDAQHTLEDSDVREEEATEDDAFLRSRRRKQIHEDFITTAESSPSGQDNDAAGAASPPPAKKGPASFFALEDDLDFSDDDDEVPLAKRAKLTLGRKASVQEPKPSPARSTPPSRTNVEKIPVSRVIPAGSAPASSVARDHPIYATVDAVADFAEQFTRLEAENAQLRKTVKSSAGQVLEANRLATDAKKENSLLKEEVSKLKQQMKDEQDARRVAAVAIDKKEGVLRESIKDLLEAANITVTRRHQLREDSTSDAMSLAESNVQVLGLLQKTRGALSRLYSMIFPKVKQEKTLGEMADAFLVDPSEPVEVLKRRSRLFGAVLTFQLLMGHGLESDLDKLSKALTVDDDNHLVDLEPFKRSAITCASQLLELVDGAQAKPTPEAAPGPSSAPP
ncbi:hypothetical protein QYE76_019754 [Lolium multiflorum]|uniref:Uncharacterized protein n=1 Tax=Lolium multiflorum TaxID=4521 RepID=A0AAD8VNG2_LOLMU|nr:hypothetical protein QYE76_019754 [Lolium multiflorum]